MFFLVHCLGLDLGLLAFAQRGSAVSQTEELVCHQVLIRWVTMRSCSMIPQPMTACTSCL